MEMYQILLFLAAMTIIILAAISGKHLVMEFIDWLEKKRTPKKEPEVLKFDYKCLEETRKSMEALEIPKEKEKIIIMSPETFEKIKISLNDKDLGDIKLHKAMGEHVMIVDKEVWERTWNINSPFWTPYVQPTNEGQNY